MVLKFTDYRLVMRRGLRRCCPQCGLTKLFTGWYDLRSRCPVCELDLRIHDQNTWAFMYLSTAVLTGLIVIGMLLIIPGNQWMGRAVVLVVAIGAIIGTLPLRKSIGVAIEYLVDLRSDHTPGLRLREPEP